MKQINIKINQRKQRENSYTRKNQSNFVEEPIRSHAVRSSLFIFRSIPFFKRARYGVYTRGGWNRRTCSRQTISASDSTVWIQCNRTDPIPFNPIPFIPISNSIHRLHAQIVTFAFWPRRLPLFLPLSLWFLPPPPSSLFFPHLLHAFDPLSSFSFFLLLFDFSLSISFASFPLIF